jgi:hypothetical protein
MPEWLLTFLPQWEQAVGCILAGTAIATAWKMHRVAAGLKPRRWAVAAVTMGVTFVIALFVVWASSRDLGQALARALVIGGASPLLWESFVAAAWKYAPWLAITFGEDRRKHGRTFLEDTEQMYLDDLHADEQKIDADSLAHARREVEQRARDEAGGKDE